VRIIMRILGVLLIVMGSIWFLQGVNMLPGSFMTGQIRWAVYGGITAIAGAILVRLSGRRRNG
jgi:hypothetical protein